MEKLSSLSKADSFDFNLNDYGSFRYKTHYDLGDLVLIQKKDWGISVVKRITEITETYEDGGMALSMTVGDPISETFNMED